MVNGWAKINSDEFSSLTVSQFSDVEVTLDAVRLKMVVRTLLQLGVLVRTEYFQVENKVQVSDTIYMSALNFLKAGTNGLKKHIWEPHGGKSSTEFMKKHLHYLQGCLLIFRLGEFLKNQICQGSWGSKAHFEVVSGVFEFYRGGGTTLCFCTMVKTYKPTAPIKQSKDLL